MEDNKNENVTPEPVAPAPEPADEPVAPEAAPVPESGVAPASENPFAASAPAAATPTASDQASEPAASSNPFAAFPTPAPAAPAAPAPQPPEPWAQQPAPAAPYEPYAVAQPIPAPDAAPYGAYGAAAPAVPQTAPQQPAAYAAPEQPFYGAAGSYGGQQPPTPPVPPAPVYGYEPPAAGGQKRRWPWFLLGLAVGLVIGLGGCVSCAGIMAAATFDDSYSDDYLYDYDYGYDDDSTWPLEDDADILDDADDPSGRLSYDDLADILEGDGLAAGTPDAEGACTEGYYTVGPEGDIPAGLYYLQGSDDALSFYYLFDGDSDGYELDDGVRYYGNYFAQLDEGDLIAFMPGADGLTMYPAPATSTNPVAPYDNGCYRVGVDIPAGSYTVTALPVPEGDESGESAAFVMKDLEFNDDSIVDTQYVIAGGKQVVTVTDGQYLELYAATATPVAQG